MSTNNHAKTRVVTDSMGKMEVPEDALYGATTQRAILNFPISGIPIPRSFIQALGIIKAACALANAELGLMDKKTADVIYQYAMDVASGKHDKDFPIDIFQTGSATSSNMNANEVIASLAANAGHTIHPNDHVNMSQSSNDVIPTAIHVSAAIGISERLLPAMEQLAKGLETKAKELQNVTKTGRTHLMDAMPVTLGQELMAFATQIRKGIGRIESCKVNIQCIAQGGTAVGTGINAHPEFGAKVATILSKLTNIHFIPNSSYFESLSSQDAAVELSGQLKTVATSLMKIANDLRWMNSGPLGGLGEIALPSLQPGSSIMPGKVNPVIPEAVCMVAAQVIGNDTTITIAGQSGNFQLNVMLPVIAYNLIQSIDLISNSCKVLCDKAILGFSVNHDTINDRLSKNPILVTALNAVIGYELGAAIAKQAYAEKRSLIDVALEKTSLSRDELEKLLDPFKLTQGGIAK